ncbi:hypothetical protein NA56DRAFT_712254 [Hyaloscypha hepaticicola]|uniref:Uncharacterized protein n=1 Tax=Hyaloscypha hepaticicola TaxID=2082293 RepID=A0A2J6PGX5_9HELO|nr:hypothetical protein NA56DRAFT_712254 [Hyaloscypha hepaticicola]
MTSSNVDLASPEPSLRATRSTSATTSQLQSVPNAFSRIMDKGKGHSLVLRDSCSRPMPAYNSNYNLYAIPNEDTPGGYSPYVFKEPLFDDRPIVVNKLPKNCILAPPLKRPRTSWVWPLGYAIPNSSRELFPVFEHILTHFENLTKQVENGEFDGYPGIARSINEIWNKAKVYYGKIDQSVTWIFSTVMNSRFKMKYFEDKWTGSESHFLRTAKPKVKKLWDNSGRSSTGRINQDVIAEGSVRLILGRTAAMAFDFLAVPAMSSECERDDYYGIKNA